MLEQASVHLDEEAPSLSVRNEVRRDVEAMLTVFVVEMRTMSKYLISQLNSSRSRSNSIRN
jgi:hypothetical protein